MKKKKTSLSESQQKTITEEILLLDPKKIPEFIVLMKTVIITTAQFWLWISILSTNTTEATKNKDKLMQ